MAISSRAIDAKGVGHQDYAVDIQNSTEPLVSSYQTGFHFAKYIAALAAGETSTFIIPITSGYLVMMYDFEASAAANEFISINIYSLVGGVASQILTKGGLQKVTVNLSKGFPFFQNMQIDLRNRSAVPLDIDFHCHGITLSEQQYYLQTTNLKSDPLVEI